MSHERLYGLEYVCRHWHSGEWSRGYRLLSKIGRKVHHATSQSERLLPRDEWREAREWAAHYTRLVRNGEISL
jgi:hypothetical protein